MSSPCCLFTFCLVAFAHVIAEMPCADGANAASRHTTPLFMPVPCLRRANKISGATFIAFDIARGIRECVMLQRVV